MAELAPGSGRVMTLDTEPAAGTVVDPDRFRHVLGHFPTGVVVATAVSGDGTPVGITVGSFMSVSLDPPLVAFLPAKSSSTFPKIHDAGHFCINVLADDQEAICRAFSARGADKYAGIGWHPAGSGSPILDGTLAWIDCDIDQVVGAGDHYIVIGTVRDLDVDGDRSPLLFFLRGYGRFAPASLSAPAQPDLLEHLRVMDCARPEMERLAGDLQVEALAVAVVGDELVTIGSAGRSFDGEHPDRLGQRMPFVPPLGALFLAWTDTAATEAWLTRLNPQTNAHDAELYRQMVERVRERGWSVALHTRTWIAFELTLANLSRRPSEDQLRGVHQAARNVGPTSHEPPAEALTRSEIRVRNVSAPVFGDRGVVVLMLTLIGLPKVCAPAEFSRYRDRLLAGCRTVTEALGGGFPDGAAPDRSQ